LRALWLRTSFAPRQWQLQSVVTAAAVTLPSDGQHWVEVRGEDLAGNLQQNVSRFHLVLDRAAPTVSVPAWLSFAAVSNDTAPRITLQRSEATARVWWALNASEAWVEAQGTGTTVDIQLSGLLDGLQVLRLKVEDDLGNRFVHPLALQWLLDTLSPSGTVLSGPPSPDSSSEGSFTLQCSGPLRHHPEDHLHPRLRCNAAGDAQGGSHSRDGSDCADCHPTAQWG
jgi:hypothetical protein